MTNLTKAAIALAYGAVFGLLSAILYPQSVVVAVVSFAVGTLVGAAVQYPTKDT